MKRKMGGWKLLSHILLGLLVLLGMVLGIWNLLTGRTGRGFLGLSSVMFLLLPLIFKKLGLGQPYRLFCVLYGFSVLAFDLGCVAQGFDRVPYFDKISHLLSGMVFTMVGYCVYFYLAHREAMEERKWISSTYALFFSIFIAVMWEVGEFAGYLLTGHDSQHTLTTGVFDTMEDLISCLAGSLVSVISFLGYVKKKWRMITGPAVKEFCDLR